MKKSLWIAALAALIDRAAKLAWAAADFVLIPGVLGVRGTRKENAGEITPREIAKIAAASMLAVRPAIAMNVHEAEPVAMAAGINQLYAEYGVNPRDCAAETSKNRGYSVQGCLELLAENGWEVPCV